MWSYWADWEVMGEEERCEGVRMWSVCEGVKMGSPWEGVRMGG